MIVHINIVDRVIFNPCNFRPSTFANSFTLLEFAPTQMCLKRDIMRRGIRPVLNSLVDNEGESGENKMGAYISSTVYIQ